MTLLETLSMKAYDLWPFETTKLFAPLGSLWTCLIMDSGAHRSFWRERVCKTAPIPRWLAHGIDALLIALVVIAFGAMLSETARSVADPASRAVLAHTVRPAMEHTLYSESISGRLESFRSLFAGVSNRCCRAALAPGLANGVLGRVLPWQNEGAVAFPGKQTDGSRLSSAASVVTWPQTSFVRALLESVARPNEGAGSAGDDRLIIAFVLFTVFVLLALYILGVCGSLRKCGYPAWFGLMPFTGQVALCEAGGNVWLWVLPRLFTNPPFSTTANAIICYGFAVSFLGKREQDEAGGLGARPATTSIWDDFTWKAFWLTVGLVFFPFVSFPLVALSDSLQYDACYRARLAERVRAAAPSAGEYIALP